WGPVRCERFDRPMPLPRTRRRGRSTVLARGSCVRSFDPGLVTFDDAAAQADFSVVEHHRLAWGDRALRRVEHDSVAVGAMVQGTRLVTLAITDLGGQPQWPGKVERIDPVDFR